MRKWFKRLLTGMGSLFTVMVVTFFIALLFPEGSNLYDLLLGSVVVMACVSPLLVLGIVVTGVGSLLQGNRDDKQKRGLMSYDDFGMQDARLERIMKQISPQDRAYLERRLADREVGLSDDGEIVSMNDLLDEFEQKS